MIESKAALTRIADVLEDLVPGQWDYVCCYCIVKNDRGSGVSITHECTACGNANLRFLHVLEHLENKRQIQGGIECARALMNDSEIPTLAESETKRKKSWRPRYRKLGRCSTTVEDLQNRG